MADGRRNSLFYSRVMNNDLRGFPATARLLRPLPGCILRKEYVPGTKNAPCSIAHFDFYLPSRFTTYCRRGAV